MEPISERLSFLDESTQLFFSRDDGFESEISGEIRAFVKTDGDIGLSCVMYSDPLNASKLLESHKLTLRGEGKRMFRAEGVTFTHAVYESTSRAQILTGILEHLVVESSESAQEVGHGTYLLLSPPVSLWEKASKSYFPNLNFTWERIDVNEKTGIGQLRVSGKDVGGTILEPSAIIRHLEVLLSLATMSTVRAYGYLVTESDGRLIEEYKFTPPVRCRSGFAIIPNYSYANRREELVHYLGEAVPHLESMKPEELEGFREAVLFNIEAEYDEYIKPKYLKTYLALVILLRTFSDPFVEEKSDVVESTIDEIAKVINESTTDGKWKKRAIGAVRSLRLLGEREKIDKLLEKYRLESLLSSSTLGRVRSAIIHAGIFRGDDLADKVNTCQEVSFGVCWLLLRIIGYTGSFNHAWKDSFYVEINALSGEEFNTRR